MGERGESAGDDLRDGVRTAGDGDQGPLGQAVVERGRGAWVAVSRARQLGAGGDGTVDRGERAGDIEEPVRLGAADPELRLAVRLPAGVPQRQPDAGAVSVADPGRRGPPRSAGRRPSPRAARPSSPGRRPRSAAAAPLRRRAPGPRCARPRLHRPPGRRAPPGRAGARARAGRARLTGSQAHSHRVYLGKRPMSLLASQRDTGTRGGSVTLIRDGGRGPAARRERGPMPKKPHDPTYGFDAETNTVRSISTTWRGCC